MTILTEWQAASASPNSLSGPVDLGAADLSWLALQAPGTAASALRQAGLWSDESRIDFDADDWWFRTTFEGRKGSIAHARFAGLATIADVWVNGAHILHSENMFVENVVSFVSNGADAIVIVCRSLRHHLRTRRSRGRWKTRLVEMQQLRWVRTTLLGRMPTWPPNAAPVGPWRPVEVVLDPDRSPFQLTGLTARVTDGNGRVEITGQWSAEQPPASSMLHVGEASVDLVATRTDTGWSITGLAFVESAVLWWPATHGDPHLYQVSISWVSSEVASTLELAPVGFRSVRVNRSDDGFRVSVNGVQLFCRGACWVPLDPVRLNVTSDELRDSLTQVVRAGMNMLRITGTMVPEQEEFYDLCDQLGILVWQDMMFANMDYPIADPEFAAEVVHEAEQLLGRLRRHPSIAVICGGSEVEQQAAMMGFDPSAFDNELGRTILANVASAQFGDVEYISCSPSGGLLPFTISAGVSHYYGVGAYMRPLDDARRAGVRFTSECLAFANVPCRRTVDEFLRDGERPAHSPRWKAAVPRDRGSGWDFEDVRDHYVRDFFDLDPATVRYSDHERYLDLGRAAVCIAIESTMSEFRRHGSSCNGALVFTLRDLAVGAGWGLIDALGRAKSAYFSMARVSRPLAVLLTDEGLNGLVAHVVNDHPKPFVGTLSVKTFGVSGTELWTGRSTIEVAAATSISVEVDGLIGGFRDLTNVYRFGPRVCDVISVGLADETGRVVSEAVHLAGGHFRPVVADVGLAATSSVVAGAVELKVSSVEFAQWVSIESRDWAPDDNWFHVVPGDDRVVTLRPTANSDTFAAEIRALNSLAVVFCRGDAS